MQCEQRNSLLISTCGHFVSFHEGGPPVQCLAAEDAAEGAVVLVADGTHYLIHGPPIQLLIA